MVVQETSSIPRPSSKSKSPSHQSQPPSVKTTTGLRRRHRRPAVGRATVEGPFRRVRSIFPFIHLGSISACANLALLLSHHHHTSAILRSLQALSNTSRQPSAVLSRPPTSSCQLINKTTRGPAQNLSFYGMTHLEVPDGKRPPQWAIKSVETTTSYNPYSQTFNGSAHPCYTHEYSCKNPQTMKIHKFLPSTYPLDWTKGARNPRFVGSYHNCEQLPSAHMKCDPLRRRPTVAEVHYAHFMSARQLTLLIPQEKANKDKDTDTAEQLERQRPFAKEHEDLRDAVPHLQQGSASGLHKYIQQNHITPVHSTPVPSDNQDPWRLDCQRDLTQLQQFRSEPFGLDTSQLNMVNGALETIHKNWLELKKNHFFDHLQEFIKNVYQSSASGKGSDSAPKVPTSILALACGGFDETVYDASRAHRQALSAYLKPNRTAVQLCLVIALYRSIRALDPTSQHHRPPVVYDPMHSKVDLAISAVLGLHAFRAEDVEHKFYLLCREPTLMFEGGLPGPAWEQFLAHHLEDRAHASNLIYLAFIASKKGSSYGPSYDKFVGLWQTKQFEKPLPDEIRPQQFPGNAATTGHMQLHWTHGTAS